MSSRFNIFLSILIIALAITLVYAVATLSRPPADTKYIQNIRSLSKDTAKKSGETKQDAAEYEVKLAPVGESALTGRLKQTYQTFNNCGPATLSMVLGFYNMNASQKELGDEMRPYQVSNGDNDDKSINLKEFAYWAKTYGLNAVTRPNGDIELLKKLTSNGIPVVVKSWLKTNDDIGHFRIIRGFNDKERVVIQDDSYFGPDKRIDYFDFLSMWQAFNYQYAIIYNESNKDVVETIIGSEIDEKLAWKSTLERAKRESGLDNKNPYPLFNISVSYYYLGDLANSALSYENVKDRLPKRMLWYQTEPVLAYQKLGRYDDALKLIENILNNGNRAFSELYQIRGEIYLKQGKNEQAQKEFDLAVYYNKNFKKVNGIE